MMSVLDREVVANPVATKPLALLPTRFMEADHMVRSYFAMDCDEPPPDAEVVAFDNEAGTVEIECQRRVGSESLHTFAIPKGKEIVFLQTQSFPMCCRYVVCDGTDADRLRSAMEAYKAARDELEAVLNS